MNGNINGLLILSHNMPSILPDIMGANQAAENDQLIVLEWLGHQYPPILPNILGANKAAANGSLIILKWLSEKIHKFYQILEVQMKLPQMVIYLF